MCGVQHRRLVCSQRVPDGQRPQGPRRGRGCGKVSPTPSAHEVACVHTGIMATVNPAVCAFGSYGYRWERLVIVFVA